jgi:hypothetical protein
MPEPRTKVTKRTEGRSASPSLESHASLPANEEGFIPPHGGYEKLLAYQKALVVYDATLHF